MSIFNRWLRTGCRRTGVVACVLAVVWTSPVMAQSMSPHHGFLGGPWEVVVKMGHEGDTLRLPVSVADENKPQDLKGTLPVMGTSIKVRLDKYVPDLKWETVAVEDPNGGAVAKLSFRGESLEQDLWLSAREVTRQTISSHIGGVALRELPAGERRAETLQRLAEPETVGVLLITLPGAEVPLVYPVKPGVSVELPASEWKVSALNYVPHYSIDRETKEVTSASDKPVNPAIEIKMENGDKVYRQWLWSKFPSSPHKRLSLPFSVRFLDFHLEAEAGRYIIVVAPGLQPRLLFLKEGKKHIEPVELGQRFPFKDKRYSFAVEKVIHGARVQNHWKNGSDTLLHPAVIATIIQAGVSQEVALEQNKPYHHKAASGTLVVLYRRVP